MEQEAVEAVEAVHRVMLPPAGAVGSGAEVEATVAARAEPRSTPERPLRPR